MIQNIAARKEGSINEAYIIKKKAEFSKKKALKKVKLRNYFYGICSTFAMVKFLETARMSDHVSYWSLLSKLYFENGNWKEAATALERAREIQLSIIAKPPDEVGNLVEEKRLAAK